MILLSRHERLSELFGNLVRNAIKYNKEGGSVTVTLNREKLEVEDTGIGISEENLGKVFSRFSPWTNRITAKTADSGWGLPWRKNLREGGLADRRGKRA